MPKWVAGDPQICSTWANTLRKWGVPFDEITNSNDLQRLECLRPLDARALDSAMRVYLPYPDEGEKDYEKELKLQRAVFEVARRNEEFLTALEAVIEARIYTKLSNESVIQFVAQHVPEPYFLAWARDLRREDAAEVLATVVRAHLEEPNTETLRAALNTWEAL